MIIRIYTEDKNSLRIRELCEKRFDAFTMYRGMGAWKGKPEPSVTIEIAVLGDYLDAIGSPDYPTWIREQKSYATRLAKDIKDLNGQEAVLIEFIESENVLI